MNHAVFRIENNITDGRIAEELVQYSTGFAETVAASVGPGHFEADISGTITSDILERVYYAGSFSGERDSYSR